MVKKKVKLEPGKTYRGSAWVNEYGEVHFTPWQQGSKSESNMTKVYEDGPMTIYQSKKMIKVSVQIDRQAGLDFKMTQALQYANFAFLKFLNLQ